MPQWVRVGVDRADWPQQPLQQINRVDPLIQQDAATIQCPGAAPGPAIVVLLRAPPGNLRVAKHQSAKRMLLHQLIHLPGGRVEAMLADDGHLDATLLLDAQHLLDGPVAHLHRLFDDDMAATAHGLTGYVAMQTTRSTNVDDRQLLTVQHLLDVALWRGPLAVRQALPPL